MTVMWQGKPVTAQRGSPQYTGLRDAILREDWAAIAKHLTMGGSLKAWLDDAVAAVHKQNAQAMIAKSPLATTPLASFTVEGDAVGSTVKFQGHSVPRAIQDRMWKMATNGESPEPLFRFYERLSRNPSKRSVDQVFNFLEHLHIPLEPDGRFLAYKGLNMDMTDRHTGTIDNSPGRINKMPRNQISDDPNEPCHEGLHVGSLRYASDFGPRVVICRIDPEHVVCVPYDYSSQKMRVCEYEVVGHHSGVPMSSTIQHADPKDNEWVDEDEEEEDEDDDGGYQTYHGDGDPDVMHEDALRDDDEDDEDADVLSPAERDQKTADKDKNAKAKSKKRAFDKKDGKALLNESIDDLRKYAGALQIVGASKIPGGKAALVSKILRTRRRS